MKRYEIYVSYEKKPRYFIYDKVLKLRGEKIDDIIKMVDYLKNNKNKEQILTSYFETNIDQYTPTGYYFETLDSIHKEFINFLPEEFL